MVSVKNLFIAASLLLSGVAAAPFPASTLSVAAAEATATIDDFAIESRDLNDVSVIDIEVRKDKRKDLSAVCPTNKPHSLERRALNKGKDPNNINENQFVPAIELGVGKTAAVINLSGCTALFIWNKNDVPSVFHIFYGNEEKDAKTAIEIAEETSGATAVSIVAAKKKRTIMQ
ncbi:hypothetical protein CC80DRAFT_584842 [Byssothecium circinans]|uniref:Uncharacterized protein n=1 Tax=Byssothecium circinans TaxID=147558 RepID=A0A6A5TCM0_9PLEO|nr:hypothetical protein CC80DRAFT_584842 [Byssothecium circinans]